MESQLHLTVEKETSGFGRLLPALDQFVERNQLESKPAFALRLVLEEIILNLIKYGKQGQRTNEVRVYLDVRADHVILAIEDDGPPFDPRSAPVKPKPAGIADAVPGRDGLNLVRNSVESLSYHSDTERNRLEVRVARG